MPKNPLLSIIIPTLNEEKRLPIVLADIHNDSFKDWEIIVADAGSKDKTCQIAKMARCKVVEGGLPAKGRNNGAKHAKGEILLFLDADAKVSHDFFLNAISEFTQNQYDIASFNIYPQKNNIFLNKTTMNLFYNYPQILLTRLFPLGAMGIMVKKKYFDEIGGFDETITLAEDHYFVGEVAKIGKFGIIKGSKLYMPSRRFEQDGYFKTAFKYLKTGIKMKLVGPEREAKYEFGHYQDDKD